MIFALVTNYGTKAKTVVELSLSKFFKRKYSSLSRAISGYFTSRKNNTNRDELRSSARNDNDAPRSKLRGISHFI